MQVKDHSEIQPILTGPNITDVARPFSIGLVRAEVTIQQVWRDVELVIAICCDLVFSGSNHGYAVLTHQPTHAAVADIQANFFQLFCHPRPALAAQTQTRLLLDMRHRHQIRSLSAAGRATAERP